MYLTTLLFIITTFLSNVFAIKNTTQTFRLKTCLKSGQPDKTRFNHLYLETYHTGAGFNDAVLVPDQTSGIEGFLNGTEGKSGGVTYQDVVFDLGSDFSWDLVMAANTNFYAAWEVSHLACHPNN